MIRYLFIAALVAAFCFAQTPHMPLASDNVWKTLPLPIPVAKDVPLGPAATEAAKLSSDWSAAAVKPAAGADGRVLYAYGAGLPIVVCAPLRVCIIELQAGERITSDPQIGDSVRWSVEPAAYGGGAERTELLVVKAKGVGLDTNIVVATDRRVYYIRLVSKPDEYIARTAFTYPADEQAKWKQHINAEKKAAEDADSRFAKREDRPQNYEYAVSGPDAIRPRAVHDDNVHTYIEMPQAVLAHEAPVLMVVGANGKDELTNYRVQETTYVVDRLFQKAHLVLGSGRKALKVEIVRSGKERG